LLAITTGVLPHSHWQSHCTRPLALFSARRIAVSLPNRCPVKSWKLGIDSFEGGVILRDSFDCPFIVVDNAIFEEPKRDVREALAYKALKAHKAHFAMPKLSEEVVDALEGCGLSLRNFVRQPMSSSGEGPVPDGLALELRIGLRAWVLKVFLEIHRVTGYLARISSSASTVASESSVQLTRGQRRIRT
jgi:hypothetical protein